MSCWPGRVHQRVRNGISNPAITTTTTTTCTTSLFIFAFVHMRCMVSFEFRRGYKGVGIMRGIKEHMLEIKMCMIAFVCVQVDQLLWVNMCVNRTICCVRIRTRRKANHRIFKVVVCFRFADHPTTLQPYRQYLRFGNLLGIQRNCVCNYFQVRWKIECNSSNWLLWSIFLFTFVYLIKKQILICL